ncbi:MAG TPA: YceI family protein [Nitrospira sp.]|nr:YceI family protein [Nitrospira sp.]
MIIRKLHLWVLGVVCAFVLTSGVAGAEMKRYEIDAEHSAIGFSIPHMTVSNVRGQFTDVSGFVELDPDSKHVKTVEATIKAATINTLHEKRDSHLRSPDFLDVEKYPTMTYKLKSYRKTGDTFTAMGDFTLHGVTKEVTLIGRFIGVTKDPGGNSRAGFTASGRINRQEFGIQFNKTLDNGGMIVGDEVTILLDVECVRAKTSAP